MTTVTQTSARSVNTSQTGVFSAVKNYFAYQSLARKAFVELNALSNRELEDLGLFRSDLARISREEARKAVQV